MVSYEIINDLVKNTFGYLFLIILKKLLKKKKIIPPLFIKPHKITDYLFTIYIQNPFVRTINSHGNSNEGKTKANNSPIK